MIPIQTKLYQIAEDLNALKQRLISSRKILLETNGNRLMVMRTRIIPDRKLFAILVPRIQVNLEKIENAWNAKFRISTLSSFMLIVFYGNLITEFTMSRTRYPRNFPPEFTYIMVVLYSGFLIYEFIQTKKTLDSILG